MNFPQTPKYIFDLLNKQLIEYQRNILISIANQYNIDQEQLFIKYLPSTNIINIQSNDKIAIEITKKIAKKNIPDDNNRCMARVWNRGKGGQCTRIKKDNCEYCLQHSQHLKHGRIDSDVPKHIFQTNSKILYK